MAYIPDRGDLIWINFNPQSGREQAGKRPALVLSPKIYNRKTNLAICCPITSKIKKHPFEVIILTPNIDGVILSDHLKSLDWKRRQAKFIEKCTNKILKSCLRKIHLLLDSQT